MSRRHADDILNINVGGKKYTVRRTDLLADPRSKLAEWFKPGTIRPIPTDRGGFISLFPFNYILLQFSGFSLTLDVSLVF